MDGTGLAAPLLVAMCSTAALAQGQDGRTLGAALLAGTCMLNRPQVPGMAVITTRIY